MGEKYTASGDFRLLPSATIGSLDERDEKIFRTESYAHMSRNALPLSAQSDDSATPAEILELGSATNTLDGLKLRLAMQVAPKLWRDSIGRMAEMVDGGTPLDEAVAGCERILPSELRSLMNEALQVRDPTALLVQSLRVRDEVRRSWLDFISLILYPCCLLMFAMAIGVAFSFLTNSMVDLDWMEDFGLANAGAVQASIQDQHHAIVGIAVITAWVGLVLLVVALLGPAWAWTSVVGGMVVVGKPLRWISLTEILYRYQIFVEQGLPTSKAGLAVARSFSRSGQAVVARAIAQRIESGVPIGKAMGDSMLADGLCRPALLLLDSRGSNMSNALLTTAELLATLSEQRCRTMAAIMPVFVLALVGTIAWTSISCYFTILSPLISLISSLA